MEIINEKQNQFISDLSKLTKIDKSVLHAYSKTNNLLNILYHPEILDVNKNQIHILKNLKTFIDNYNFLNATYENSFAIACAEDYFNFVQHIVGINKETEMFVVGCLDTKNRIIHHEIISFGDISSCAIDFRKLTKTILNSDAKNCIVAHNHPSGYFEFSVPDIEVTYQLISMLAPMDIKVLDHIVVSNNKFISMHQNNIIDFSKAHDDTRVDFQKKANKKRLTM